MQSLTFKEIRDIVHDICREVDENYSDDVDTYDAIAESCNEYFVYHSEVWQVAMGMRFQYFDAWYDAEQALEGCAADWTMDEYLFVIVHECLRLLVQDAHENGDHLTH